MQKVQIEFRTEIGRKPEQIEPPDRISEKLGGRICPSLAIAEKSAPRNGRARFRGCVLVDMLKLSGRKGGMLLGSPEITEPPQDPKHAENAGSQKGCVPAVAQRHPGYNGRGQDRSDIRSGVEDASG